MIVLSNFAYHGYKGLATNFEEKEILDFISGARNFLTLRNRDTLTFGENCPLVFLRMYFLKQACKAKILVQTSHQNPLTCSDDINARFFDQAKPAFSHGLTILFLGRSSFAASVARTRALTFKPVVDPPLLCIPAL